MFRMTSSIFASGMATRWFFAAPMAWKRLLVRAQFSATILHVGVEPTIEMPLIFGLFMNVSATTRSPHRQSVV